MPEKRRKMARAVGRIEALPWQQAGARSRATATSERIQKALDKFEAQLVGGELDRIPTYADIIRRAGVDRKTLFGKAQAEKLVLVDQFLKRAHAALGKAVPIRPQRQTYYERISVNAQEAEAVRIRKQTEIDKLSSELREARQQIEELLSHAGIRLGRTSKSRRPTRSPNIAGTRRGPMNHGRSL